MLPTSTSSCWIVAERSSSYRETRQDPPKDRSNLHHHLVFPEMRGACEEQLGNSSTKFQDSVGSKIHSDPFWPSRLGVHDLFRLKDGTSVRSFHQAKKWQAFNKLRIISH